MVACAISAAPREACGLLVVDSSGQFYEYVPAMNLSVGFLDYSIDPEAQRSLLGRTVGVFHSHVTRDAYPSVDDSRLAVDGLLYVIYSLHDREFRYWRRERHGWRDCGDLGRERGWAHLEAGDDGAI